ncbi:luciferin 4-monooxygenase-like [Dermacentor silvarum]|uniref:luciferin 4-monooxygenase-like n=1 Tax=Dermacentor silvarum TaxID=543639 RepID=UPI00189B2AC8|nr:luciferin 4-monooxygenase-like [Dermacentor silvarum]
MLAISASSELLVRRERRTATQSHLQDDQNDETLKWKARIHDNIVHSPYPERPVPRVPIHVAVRDALHKLGPQVVMIDGNVSITAARLLDKMEAYAATFRSHGVKRGDRICCHFSNGIDSFAALFGVIFAGAVAVLADDELTKTEVLSYAKDGKAEYVLTDKRNAEKFRDIRQTLKRCFVVGGDVPGFQSVSAFQAADENTLQDIHYPGQTEVWPAAISFSSGTTGTPKKILITHYAFVSSITTFRSCHLLQPGDRYVTLESMAHAFGFFFTMYAACLGATMVVTPTTPESEDLVDIVNKHKVQVICCFPTVLSRISRDLDAMGRRLMSVRKVLCTGGPVPRNVGERILRQLHLTDFKNFLGCSEGLSPYCVPPPGETNYECVGFPSPNVQIMVADPITSVALGPGEQGEIWVKTPGVTPGYLNQDDQLECVVDQHAWLHTGDLGYYNKDGRFFVIDRLKNIIKCHDYNVAPRELEAILLSHPAVLEACVIGIPDEKVSEAPTAFVVSRKSALGDPLVTEEELVDLVASQTTYYKHLYGGVVFLDELPRTVNGKTNVKKLRLLKPSTQQANNWRKDEHNVINMVREI